MFQKRINAARQLKNNLSVYWVRPKNPPKQTKVQSAVVTLEEQKTVSQVEACNGHEAMNSINLDVASGCCQEQQRREGPPCPIGPTRRQTGDLIG